MDPRGVLFLLAKLDPEETKKVLKPLTMDQKLELMEVANTVIKEWLYENPHKDMIIEIIQLLTMNGMFIGKELDNL